MQVIIRTQPHGNGQLWIAMDPERKKFGSGKDAEEAFGRLVLQYAQELGIEVRSMLPEEFDAKYPSLFPT